MAEAAWSGVCLLSQVLDPVFVVKYKFKIMWYHTCAFFDMEKTMKYGIMNIHGYSRVLNTAESEKLLKG